METLKDIFVSYEIAQKLKEIGFDEKCIASWNIGRKSSTIMKKQGDN
ncbi:hypothetical protein [Capnocytophaga cynodegmi]|nr:hypothetical protein [Capnocytophaga cynodegmi]